MSTFLHDLRQAFLNLLKAPAFTVTAILTLALGIGANTAMFSAIHALLLKPLPYPEPNRLVAIWETQSGRQNGQPNLRHQILALVLGQGLRLAIGGVALGLLGSLLMGRVLASHLYGLKAMDPLTCIAVAVLLLTVTLLACLVPSLRAAWVDPAIALRSE